MSVQLLQANLGHHGLYLGKVDGLPGPATCDALVRFLVGDGFAPPAGRALASAIPASWWASPDTVNMMLANVQAECGFRPVQECLNYTPERLCAVFPQHFPTLESTDHYAHSPELLGNFLYGDRADLGNRVPGDGYKYRGRGWPQLTGRGAYVQFSAPGRDLVNNPDLMLDLSTTAMVTVLFCAKRLGTDLMASGDVVACRHRWNGGANGLKDAQDAFAKLTSLWGAQ